MRTTRKPDAEKDNEVLVICPNCYEKLKDNKRTCCNIVCCPYCNSYINRYLPTISGRKPSTRTIGKERRKEVKHKLYKLYNKLSE